jgi:hypothetical protein
VEDVIAAQVRRPAVAGSGRFIRWWPWLLALIMLVVFVVMVQVPFLREFYELTPLPANVLVMLLVVAGIWTAAVHALRRTGIVARVEDVLWAAVMRAWHRLRPPVDAGPAA